jgi:hypothetical protein
MPALQANPSDFLPPDTMLDHTITSWVLFMMWPAVIAYNFPRDIINVPAVPYASFGRAAEQPRRLAWLSPRLSLRVASRTLDMASSHLDKVLGDLVYRRADAYAPI